MTICLTNRCFKSTGGTSPCCWWMRGAVERLEDIRATEFSHPEGGRDGRSRSLGRATTLVERSRGNVCTSDQGDTAETAAVPNQHSSRVRSCRFTIISIFCLPSSPAVRRWVGCCTKWSDEVAALDRDDVCGADEKKDCNVGETGWGHLACALWTRTRKESIWLN